MTKIKLNNYECEIDSYNRNTSVMGETISSSGSFSITNGDAAELNALIGTAIESIEIDVNDTKIYELNDINAEITSVNEFLSGDRMTYSVSINFK